MRPCGSQSPLCAFLLLTAALAVSGPGTAAARETCPHLIKRQDPVAVPSATVPPGQTMTAVNNEGAPIQRATLVMDFGSSREIEVRTQTYRVSNGIDGHTVRVAPVNDFVSGNTPLPRGPQQLTYRAGVDPTTGLVNVRVCYDPGSGKEPAAGRYVGAMMVSAPGVAAIPLTVEFTVRDNDLAGAVIALILGILVGLVVQAIAIYQQAPKDSRPPGWRPYLINLRTLFSAGAGVVAAIATYSKAIDGDPTWNASVATLFALASASFFGTLAAKTAADLKGPTKKEKSKGLAV